MSIRTSALTVAASLCMLPHIQADSVFNFDSDAIGGYSNGIGFVNVNNGIAAAFYPSPGGFQVQTAYFFYGTYLQPLETLSGNVLVSFPTLDSTNSVILANPTIGIAFSSDVTTIRLNYALDVDYVGGRETISPVTVNAYNNGIFVGSETTTGAIPPPICCNYGPAHYADEEGVGGFIGAPFNEVTITDTYPLYPVCSYCTLNENYDPFMLVDNIDISAAEPEPASIGLFAGGLMLAGLVVRSRARH